MLEQLTKRLGIFLVVSVLVLSFGGACGRGDTDTDENDGVAAAGGEAENGEDGGDEKGDSGEEGDDEEEAVPVEIVALERGRIESILRFSTNLEAENEVQVLSEAARRVTELLVEEGDVVRRGQVLIRLQSEAQETELARVKSQLANAKQEFERQTNLFNQQLISEEEFNEATYQLEQLELALKDARRELGYTQVRAPISGTITERLVNVGDYVTINQRLFDIIDFDSIVARIYVPEKELAKLAVGQEARLFAEAADSDKHYGNVDRIAPRVDPRSGTVKVTVAIPPSEGLLPGMYVTVELITDTHDDAVLVPKKALVYDADQLFIFRLREDDTVERLLIRAVLEDRDNIEPAGVLDDGDRVVVAGQASLKEGSTVRIVTPGAAEVEPETESAG